MKTSNPKNPIPQMIAEGLSSFFTNLLVPPPVSVEMDLSDQVCLSPWAEQAAASLPPTLVEDTDQMYAVGAMMGKYRYQLAALLR